MTATDIESWELTVPDEVTPCWVYAMRPDLCPDSLAVWMVQVQFILKEFAICDGCKNRWASYGTITSVRPIRMDKP